MCIRPSWVFLLFFSYISCVLLLSALLWCERRDSYSGWSALLPASDGVPSSCTGLRMLLYLTGLGPAQSLCNNFVGCNTFSRPLAEFFS
jgi:hypothetical protein